MTSTRLLLGGTTDAHLGVILREAISNAQQAVHSRNLQDVADLLTFCSRTLQMNPKLLFTDELEGAVRHICFPITSCGISDGKTGDKPPADAAAYQAACEFLASVMVPPLRSHHAMLAEVVRKTCKESLSNYREELHGRHQESSDLHEGDSAHDDELCNLHISAAVTILSILSEELSKGSTDKEDLLRDDLQWWQEVTEETLDIFESAEPSVCVQLAQIIVSGNGVPGRTTRDVLWLVWTRLLEMRASAIQYSESVNENIFLILCTLSNAFLPYPGEEQVSDATSDEKGIRISASVGEPDVLSCHKFWDLIQKGLVHSNPLTRKRAGYLMKRAVHVAASRGRVIGQFSAPSPQPLFCWNPSLEAEACKLWNDFFLLYETLNEVQIHVVTPVMPRLAQITKATYIQDNQAVPLLHSSWLCILYQRCFAHESKTITRLGVTECLNLDLAKSLFLHHNGIQFILGPLLTALHEEYLYTKPPDTPSGVRPAISRALQQFLTSCISILPEKRKISFLVELLAAICEQSWGPVTVVFLAEALASLPQCPAWGQASLFMLRDKLSSGFLTCPSGYRASIQCLFLRASLHLLDWNAISLRQVSMLFSVCNAAEVLKRGSPLWDEVSGCLQDCISRPASTADPGHPVPSLWQECIQEVEGHIHVDPCIDRGDLPDVGEARRVAVVMLLVADAQHRSGQESSYQLSDLLHPVTGVLSRVESHVYQPALKSDKALQVLLALVQESETTAPNESNPGIESSLTAALCSTLDEIFQYILRRLLGNHESVSCDISRVALYRSFLHTVLSYGIRVARQAESPTDKNLMTRIAKGKDQIMEGCRVLMKSTAHSQLQRHTLTSLLTWLLRSDAFVPIPLLPPSSEMLASLMAVEALVQRSPGGSSESQNETLGSDASNRGRIQSDLIRTKWEAILALIHRCDRLDGSGDGRGDPTPVWQSLFSCYLCDVSLVSAAHAVPLLQCAVVLVDKIADENIPLCLEGVSAAWVAVLDGWRSNLTFWCVYETFVAVAYQPALLQYGEGSEVHEVIQKFTSKILSQGQTRLGMVNTLTSHLERMLSQHFFERPATDHRCDAMAVIRSVSRILQEAALFGPVISKSIRLMEDVSAHLMNHEGLLSVRPVLIGNSNATDTRHPRVSVINILVQIGNSTLQGKEEFLENFFTNLIEKDEQITPVKRSYVINSVVHRTKLRIWQTANIILHFLSLDSASQALGQVLRSLRAENQTSTRHLMEVCIVRMIQLHPRLLDQFWRYAAEVANSHEISFSPLVMIIAHLGTVQPLEQQESFYMRAIPTILPWTFVPTMALRVQSQVALCKMWKDCQEAGLASVIDRFPGVAVCMDFTQNNSALHQLRLRIDNSFFLKYFHPIHDYSVETIFHTMPYLTLVTDDELVQPRLFMSDVSPWKHGDGPMVLPLYSSRDTLRTCKLKEKKKAASVKDAEIREVSWLEDGAGDVQKKITPSKECHIPGFEPSAGQKSPRGHLVVVASLVDRIPNLGGLCRTCEIFGASCLVLGNLCLKDHQDFLSLSVSAERWLPIREVKPSDLKDYMLEMRKHGYSLVGVEQTANSKPLTHFKFPQRTMLLLGKEREGIPVDLIQLLDVCVEIPQLGFIRSLNVHVSGALMIWEYTRQLLLGS